MNDLFSSNVPLNGRFAPSPTGEIHAGTIFAALQVWLISRSTCGRIVMRIEDLDPDRSKKAFTDSILRNYDALGLTWDIGPLYQHNRDEAYDAAFKQIKDRAEVYPCFCTRADLRSASAAHLGEHAVYDRKCLQISKPNLSEKHTQRILVPDNTIQFNDLYQGLYSKNLERDCGDFILKRADGGYAYQLAVVVDDAESNINCVARGYDLLPSTPQQIFLHNLLGNEIPKYAHFPLFCAPNGKRLAKRNRDASFDELLYKYKTPEALLGHIAYIGGLQPNDEPTSAENLLKTFSLEKMQSLYKDRISIEYD